MVLRDVKGTARLPAVDGPHNRPGERQVRHASGDSSSLEVAGDKQLGASFSNFAALATNLGGAKIIVSVNALTDTPLQGFFSETGSADSPESAGRRERKAAAPESALIGELETLGR